MIAAAADNFPAHIPCDITADWAIRRTGARPSPEIRLTTPVELAELPGGHRPPEILAFPAGSALTSQTYGRVEMATMITAAKKGALDAPGPRYGEG